MKTILIALAALLVIGGGYYWYVNNGEVEMEENGEVEEEVMEENEPASSGKLNINVVCEGALAYMSFPDGESADAFVAECKAGEHPEVIERYKAEMNLGDGAAI
jgi:hypothetical protein